MKRILSVLLLAVCATIVCAQENQSYNYQRALEALQEDNLYEGEYYLDLEIEANPQNGLAYVWLGWIKTYQDEIGEAIKLYHKALPLIPESETYYKAWTHWALGKIYLELEEPDKSIEHLTSSIESEPDNNHWLIERAEVYNDLGRLEEALKDCELHISRFPGEVAAYIMKSTVLYKQKKYQETLKTLAYAQKLNNNNAYIYSMMAKAENALGRYEDAADHLMTILVDGVYEEDIEELIVKENMELLDELIPRLKVQIAKYPHMESLQIQLLVIYLTQENYEDAITTIEGIKSINDSEFWDYALASTYTSLGDYNTALQYALKAYELDNTYEKYNLELIQIYDELNRFDDALYITSKMLEQDPENYNAHLYQAETYFEMKNYSKAIESYNIAIALNSSNHYARYRRGYAHLLNNDSVKANKDFLKLCKEAEGEIEHVFALIHLGETEKARLMVDSLCNIDSVMSDEQYNIACCYALLGENELAFSTLEAVLKNGYTQFNHIRRDLDFVSLHGERMDALLQKYETLVQNRVQALGTDTTVQEGETQIVEIPFTTCNGVTKVDCTINKLPLNFVFDTGASQVTISQVEANFMFKNGYLSPRDIVGKETYQVATGAIAVGTTIVLREIEFGGITLNDVRASVVETQNAPLLLGQSVFQRLGKIEIDNINRVLKITTAQ